MRRYRDSKLEDLEGVEGGNREIGMTRGACRPVATSRALRRPRATASVYERARESERVPTGQEMVASRKLTGGLSIAASVTE